MTRKLFWENPYQTELTTTITSLMENDLTLAETILYAFSGGQEGDAGTIADRVVLAARKQEREIIYTLAVIGAAFAFYIPPAGAIVRRSRRCSSAANRRPPRSPPGPRLRP